MNIETILNRTDVKPFYHPQNQPYIVGHIKELASSYGSVENIIENLSQDQYRPNIIIVVKLLVPFYYSGREFKVHVHIRISHSFPHIGPETFVVPTSTMTIAPNHKHVDKSGKVFCKYITNWSVHQSSLKGLVESLTQIFSESPPVYKVSNTSQQKHMSMSQYPQQRYSGTNMSHSTATPYTTRPSQDYSKQYDRHSQNMTHSMNYGHSHGMNERDELIQRIASQISHKKSQKRAEYKKNIEKEQKKMAILESAIEAHKNTVNNILSETKQADEHQRNVEKSIKEMQETITTIQENSENLDMQMQNYPFNEKVLETRAKLSAMKDVIGLSEELLESNLVSLDEFVKGVRDKSKMIYIMQAFIDKQQQQQQQQHSQKQLNSTHNPHQSHRLPYQF